MVGFVCEYDVTSTMSPGKFALRFLVTFAIVMGGFELSRGSAFERGIVEGLVVAPTAAVINILTPSEPVRVEGRSLVSSGARLTITRGCEGVETFALLISAVLAVPASLLRRTIGVLLGAALTYLLSVGRLVVLFDALRHHPAVWEAIHGLVAPLVPIVVVGLFFSRWLAASHVSLEVSHAR